MENNSTSTSGQELQLQSMETQSVKMRDQLAVRSTEKDLKESGKLLSQTTKMANWYRLNNYVNEEWLGVYVNADEIEKQ